MTEYTRVTVQGVSRKADLVLPDDEPLAALLPDVLALLDEGMARSPRPVALVTRVGDQLDASLTLAEQDVQHGTFLRIVRVDEAPPPPEVADITDLTADHVANRADAWGPQWATGAAAVVAAVLGYFTASLAAADFSASTTHLLLACLTLTASAALAARKGLGALGVVAAATAAGVAAPTAALVTTALHGTTNLFAPLTWFALVCAVLAVVGAAGFTDRALGFGGAIGAVLVAALLATHQLGWEDAHGAAVVGVVGLVLLGLLPGVSMTLSGLSGLHDRMVEGERVPRTRAVTTVDVTFRALTSATVATAVVSGACAWVLANDSNLWSRLLATAFATVLLLRTRVMPLAPQRLVLLTAGAVPLVALLVHSANTDPSGSLAAAVVGLALVALARSIPTSEVVLARLRQVATVIELIAVLCLVPLVLAQLGVFADLLETF